MGFFAKGIRLPRAVATRTLNLIDIPLPQRVVLPLRQYIGEPAKPVVKPGGKVKAGQVIATAESDTALPLAATISGKVSEIIERRDYQGQSVQAIIIESDGKDTHIKPPKLKKCMSSQTPDEILARIHAAGLITRGLHPLPLGKDLLPDDQPKTHLFLTRRKVVQKIDTVIINCLDSEPSLAVNRYLSGVGHEDLAAGIAAIKNVTGAENIVFVLDKQTPPSDQFAEMVAADEEETTIIVKRDIMRYPMGLPVPLIKAILGREVPLPYGHPRDVGVALFDLNTIISLGKVLRTHLAPVDTLITIGGGAFSQQGIAQVRLGTEIGALVEALGGFTQEPAKIILGGPMMGVAQYDLTTPITRETPGLFALTRDEIVLVGDYRECINCGLCVKVCPVNLVPGVLSMYCAKDRFETAEKEGLFTCIECGCCDYVCPSRRPMVHLFRHAKHQLTEGS